MSRSIEEISKDKTTQELRKEAVALLRQTKIPFVQVGIERTPGYIQSNGRKQDCIEYISLVEGTLAQDAKKSTVEPQVTTTKSSQVKTPKTPKNTQKTTCRSGRNYTPTNTPDYSSNTQRRTIRLF